jgi:chromate transporter
MPEAGAEGRAAGDAEDAAGALAGKGLLVSGGVSANGDLARPESLWALFSAFSILALQGFGGVLAVAQRELCERRRWLSAQEFVETLATAQVLPGPNVCNLSLMIGDRFFGWRGACAALAGMIAGPMVLMLGLAWLLGEASAVGQVQGVIKGVLGGIAAVAAGQIVGTVLKLAAPIKNHVLGWPLCTGLAAAAFVMMTWLHWPLVWVLLGLGTATCIGTYGVLRHRATQAGISTGARS